MAINTTPTDSTDKKLPEWRPQVFINFRGADLRDGFISHLRKALRENHIKYYIDSDEPRGSPIEILFDRIKESQIALVFFSSLYADSTWCLDELVEIMKNMEKGTLRVIPIFFKVTPEDVKGQKKEFGVALYGEGRRRRPRMPQWEDALEAIPTRMGLVLLENSSHQKFLAKVIKKVKEVEAILLSERSYTSPTVSIQHLKASLPPYEQRLKQFEERFCFDTDVTQIFAIVGMPGIGKTTLAKKHFDKWMGRVSVNKIILGIHERDEWSACLCKELLDDAQVSVNKSFIFLDDVSEKTHVHFLLNNLHRVKEGSKIVITTRDKSCIRGLIHHTYEVPVLNQNEALQLFQYHAFNNQDYAHTHNFINMSQKFVDYAGGNPRVLEELGKELCGKNEDDWGKILEALPHCCNENIKRGLRISYDKLTDQQKDAFLDIACFFRSEDEDHLTSLLASQDSHQVRDLADKFMISVSSDKIEMPDILCSFGKELGLSASLQDNLGTSRLWDHDKVIEALTTNEGKDSTVRGILLDVSKLQKEFSIRRDKLALMPNLRYLKIFDSSCPRQCKVVNVVECKVYVPDELEMPLTNIRYLHWLKFPSKQLPSDFNAENLIDLRLPYSKIERIWKDVKDTPNLKWVDLSHSTDLIDLSALCKAKSLERLNLEGCTELVDLPEDTENMKSLAFLNLRGCTSLSSLPEMENLTSLKTLILSGCSSFDDFQVKSENLEHLHLDGTEIKKLPQTIEKLQRLIVLNLKDCKMLVSLPDCLGKLKALEELLLSGCSRLRSFPVTNENMKNLQILLLDGTKFRDLPKNLLGCANSDQVNLQRPPLTSNGLSLLRRLCLSGNDMIVKLQSSLSDLYHLKWIDLKDCKKLVSISTLPPNLQCLDAHDCVALKTVASPLARLMPTEQVSSSFIFTNCGKLEHVAKNEITCYGLNKGRLLSETLNRHNKGLCFEALVATCFPGSEVPDWFGYKASGAMLEPELPRHWSESGFVGIALCAIVLFEEQKIKNNNLQVKCICDFNNVKTSSSYFHCPVGGLSETCNEQRTISSTHVFIGYTNWLNIKKCQEEDGKKGCVPTKASIKFQVTNDIGEVTNCEVLKCGFSLVYETGSWEANSRTYDVKQGEAESIVKNNKVSKIMIPNCGVTTIPEKNQISGEESCRSTKS
uniref:ADP-ribosyl cyclase/cyclic ADP-ribose hydrolase n=1 Tax=Noccaea caerulescens TaxID=107243 RepID=A0A1J3FWU4_NOCCA